MEEKIHHLEQGVLSGDREAVRTACRQLLEAGMPPQKIVRFGLLPCMDTLGQQLSRREKFIPQIMMSARAVQDGIDLLSPLIVGPDVLSLSETVVLGTVSGDIHTIGKTLVSIMLRSAGFHVVDLGTNVPPEKFVAAARENNSHIIAISAMLTTTMATMDQTMDTLRENDMLDKVSVMVGGAPLSDEYAVKIGANYSEDAVTCVELADKLVS